MKRILGWSTLALACLLASGCKDRNEPPKPITTSPIVIFIDG